MPIIRNNPKNIPSSPKISRVFPKNAITPRMIEAIEKRMRIFPQNTTNEYALKFVILRRKSRTRTQMRDAIEIIRLLFPKLNRLFIVTSPPQKGQRFTVSAIGD